ncbi:MAG TPA: hypothetical protein VJ372_22910 [Pyrinomonadaceae bacterium]|jgi:hypothetical protein|nr:hypothetical protein [Pyrinomonadaceae bacterium]
MRLRPILVIAAFALGILFCSLLVEAKGTPELIVIKGGGLSKPLEITDQVTLKKFNPWGGEFVDSKFDAIAKPATLGRCFDVDSFMKWPSRPSWKYDRGELKLIYHFTYCTGGTHGNGYIFLPGREDEYWKVNVFTILRDGDDGKWHLASAEWAETVKRLVK